jgi:hypothetical protein
VATVFAEGGWEHEVWSGADAQLLANLRFDAPLLFEPLPHRQRLAGAEMGSSQDLCKA